LPLLRKSLLNRLSNWRGIINASEIFEPLCGRKHSMFTAEARPPLYSERCANAIEAEYRKMWLQHLQETP
jgi:hypothetical protein